ncbi:MAG: hypothetical protein OET90_06095, partial [Desulfuromonadales bacterium]|nr:hypothetical protein [Desulfuromonadales bacterium]
MKAYQTHKFLSGIAFLLIVLVTAPPVNAASPTERDWMIALVDTLGWSFGLPDEPQDPDYINILTGNRKMRLEAEDIYAKGEDNVSLMTFQNFGLYSGIGWLQAPGDPTKLHLRFNLPITGKYTLQAKLMRTGHEFHHAETTLSADGADKFVETIVGEFELEAGAQEIVMTLPSNGAIDYIELSAPNLPAIIPTHGWRPNAPLRWEVLNTTTIQLLGLAEVFPQTLEVLCIECENTPSDQAKVVSIEHFGRPSQGRWLRTGSLPAKLEFRYKLSEPGFYDLTIRAKGAPIPLEISDHEEITLEGLSYLTSMSLKPAFYFAGAHRLALELPPNSGIDSVTLTPRQVTPENTQI